MHLQPLFVLLSFRMHPLIALNLRKEQSKDLDGISFVYNTSDSNNIGTKLRSTSRALIASSLTSLNTDGETPPTAIGTDHNLKSARRLMVSNELKTAVLNSVQDILKAAVSKVSRYITDGQDEYSSLKTPLLMAERNELPVPEHRINIPKDDDLDLVIWSKSVPVEELFDKMPPKDPKDVLHEQVDFASCIQLIQLSKESKVSMPFLEAEALARMRELGLTSKVIAGFSHFEDTKNFGEFALNLKAKLFNSWKTVGIDEVQLNEAIAQVMADRLISFVDGKFFQKLRSEYLHFIANQ